MAATVKTTYHKASILGAVEGFYADIEELAGEIGEWRDNLEDKLSHTEKYQTVSSCADELEGITANGDEPDFLSDGPDDECSYAHGKKSSSKSPYPRWLRRDNAVNMLRSAIGAIETRIEHLNESIEACDDLSPEATKEELDTADANRGRFQEQRDELEEYKNSLEEHAEAADGVKFPGMYG